MEKVVVLLSPTPPPAGGIAGWTVRMLATKLPNDFRIELVDTKLIEGDQVFNRQRRVFRELKRLFAILKKLNALLKRDEVVLVHSATPAGKLGLLREFLCILLTKMYKKKYVIHYRCTLPNVVKGFFHQKLFNITAAFVDSAIVLNEESLCFFEKNINSVAPELIPNFIEVSKEPRQAKRFDKERGIKNILYVGGVIPSKGSETMIKAARLLPAYNFNFVGYFNPASTSEQIPTNVRIHGEKDKLDVQKAYESNDLFAFVGDFRSEGFSNALAEAMSYGLPCIASNWAANPDMIEDKGGVVIPPQDVNALVSSIVKLSEDSSFYESASKWNLRKVENKYSESVVVKKYVNLYRALT